ncbi:hypothetical protein BYT27DRAFT_6759316 [Phlegmacium glaucopus]|nr:hypothetical protein BYT27DRAFT_6759316 [Phlegmacium glaucopus]
MDPNPSIVIESPDDTPSLPYDYTNFSPYTSPCPSSSSFESLNDSFSYSGQPYLPAPYALVNHPSLSGNPPSSYIPVASQDPTGWPGINDSLQSPSPTRDTRSSIKVPGTLQELCRLFVTQEKGLDPLSNPDLILSHIHQNSNDAAVINSLTSTICENGLTLTVGTKAVKSASAARRKKNGKFFCRVCAADLTTKGNAQNHVMAHFRLRLQVCDLCGASFGTSLTRHSRTCRENPPMYSIRRFEDSPNPSLYDVPHFSDPGILASTQDPMIFTSASLAQSSHSPILPDFYNLCL